MASLNTPLMSSISGFSDNNNNNNYYTTPNSQHQMMNQLQSILQIQLIRNFSSGNFFIDTIIQIFIMTFITYLISQIKKVMDGTGNFISWMITKLCDMMRYIYFKFTNRTNYTMKRVNIPYITDNRSINQLYGAVHWYLSNHSDLDHSKASDMQYVYDKKIYPKMHI